MSKLADERLAIEGKEKDMREMVVSAENKRSWFSSFRDWVETVAAFLDEKVRLSIMLISGLLSLKLARCSTRCSRSWRQNICR